MSMTAVSTNTPFRRQLGLAPDCSIDRLLPSVGGDPHADPSTVGVAPADRCLREARRILAERPRRLA